MGAPRSARQVTIPVARSNRAHGHSGSVHCTSGLSQFRIRTALPENGLDGPQTCLCLFTVRWLVHPDPGSFTMEVYQVHLVLAVRPARILCVSAVADVPQPSHGAFLALASTSHTPTGCCARLALPLYSRIAACACTVRKVLVLRNWRAIACTARTQKSQIDIDGAAEDTNREKITRRFVLH